MSDMLSVFARVPVVRTVSLLINNVVIRLNETRS